MAAVLDCEISDCHNLLMVELAQPEVFVLVLVVIPVYTALLSALLRVPATWPALSLLV